MGDNAACRSEAERLRLAIELAPEQPWLRTRGSPARIDFNALHRGEIDDEAIVADGTPGDIVAAAADRKRQSLLACELHASNDVGRPDAAVASSELTAPNSR